MGFFFYSYSSRALCQFVWFSSSRKKIDKGAEIPLQKNYRLREDFLLSIPCRRILEIIEMNSANNEFKKFEISDTKVRII